MNLLSRWDDPIFRREMIRLERRRTSHRWRSVAIISALCTILAMLFVLLLWMYPSSYGQQYIWMFFPSWALWVIYAVTVLQAIIASVGILSAEYTDQTWEPLIITGISAKRILMGSWLAALHRIRGWLFFLAIARIAVLPVYLLVSTKVAQFACGPLVLACIRQPSTLGTASLAVGMTVALTILDIACCVLIGLAAGAITRHSRAAVVFAILLRFSPLIVFLAFGVDYDNFWVWWASPPFALVDGGTAPAVQLIMPLLPNWLYFNPLLGLLLLTVALTIILLIMLSITFVLLRRNSRVAHSLPQ
jgi:hypothetical protein